jgi:hypothetical protein
MDYLIIYKYSNDEELATIKCLLDLRKQPYIKFEDLVSRYAEEFNIDIEQIEDFSKLYTECLTHYINFLMDNFYLLVYTKDLDKIKIPYLTYIYSLNIDMKVINNDLPF